MSRERCWLSVYLDIKTVCVQLYASWIDHHSCHLQALRCTELQKWRGVGDTYKKTKGHGGPYPSLCHAPVQIVCLWYGSDPYKESYQIKGTAKTQRTAVHYALARKVPNPNIFHIFKSCGSLRCKSIPTTVFESDTALSSHILGS